MSDFLHFFGKLGVLRDALSDFALKIQKFSKFQILMPTFDLFPNFHTSGWIFFILGKLGVSNVGLSKSELKFQNFSKFWILISTFDLFPNFHTSGWIFFVFWANLGFQILLYSNLNSNSKISQNFGY